MNLALQVLKHYYGYDSFRPGQAETINSLLLGQDTVAIMPTGAGKSMCFQIPAMLLSGITLVVSPLISLMKDQVDSLHSQGIAAVFINSTLSISQVRERLHQVQNGQYKLVYVAPERLESIAFQDVLQDVTISMVAVDEAHCVSQWGHDFRPSYQSIRPFISRLPKRPIIGAFTATATPEVRSDIIELLLLAEPRICITGFDRPNLSFSVLRGEDKQQFVLDYVRRHPQQTGIVYTATRKDVGLLQAMLAKRGIKAGCYHAGLSDEQRSIEQERFLYDDIQVMIATNAFGMGIDKSNVRYVIHYHMPKNMEAYYQEAGRSGRDGEPGECILLFNQQDVMLQKFLIEKSVDNLKRKQHELGKLHAMVDYCHTPNCLRNYILAYFGETITSDCGNCANCIQVGEQVDITIDAQKALSCVYRLRERFGVVMVAEVLKGSKTKKLLQFGLEQLPTYGLFAERTLAEIKNLLQRLLATGYLALTESEYPVLKLTPQGIAVLRGQLSVYHKFVKQPAAPKADNSLFELLRQLRRQLAERDRVPPYVVFADSTLQEMCRQLPQTAADLRLIKGVGEMKLSRYGQDFLAVIRGQAGGGSNDCINS